VLWMGDELAVPNDPEWASEPGHEGDNRWVHRPRMPWHAAAHRRDPGAVQGRVFEGLQRLAGVRARLPHLHASVAAQVLEPSDPGVLPVLRQAPIGAFLCLYNVTGSWRPYPLHRIGELGMHDPVDALTGQPVHRGDDGQTWLPPYAAVWLVERPLPPQ
jgi:amylosucrase